MKKAAAVLVILAFFLANCGYFVFYVLKSRELKQEMRAYIQSHPGVGGVQLSFELKDDKVAEPSFSWEEKGKEFSYNGHMYDVISIKKQNGKLIIHCISDNQENQLKLQLAKMNGKQKLHLKFLSINYTDKVASFNIQSPSEEAPAKASELIQHIHLLTLPKHSPPPKSA